MKILATICLILSLTACATNNDSAHETLMLQQPGAFFGGALLPVRPIAVDGARP